MKKNNLIIIVVSLIVGFGVILFFLSDRENGVQESAPVEETAANNFDTILKKIPDFYEDHYHGHEMINDHLYVIRRIGDTDSQEWMDELWRYDMNGVGKRLYFIRGLDFRVSPEERWVAISHSTEYTALTLLKINKGIDGSEMTQYSRSELAISDDAMVTPLGWRNDDVWLKEYYGLLATCILSVSADDGVVNSYDISALKTSHSEIDVDTEGKRLVYSTYVSPLEYDPEAGPLVQKETIFIYDLHTKSLKPVVEFKTSYPPLPRWIGENTIEYHDENNDTITIEID